MHVTFAGPPPPPVVAVVPPATGGWTRAVRASRPLVGEIEGLREQLRVAGLVRIVLAAPGGVGVAAELLAGGDPRLVVLDGTDPLQVDDALAGDLDATVLVIAAPPVPASTGIDPDTAALGLLWDTVHRAMSADGLDPAARTVLVAPEGSPLLARAAGATVVLGPADVDGPWTALSAYALVPAGLAGADVATILELAGSAQDCVGDPARQLGALLADAAAVPLTGAAAEWVAQLLATGLHGWGPLPVVLEGPGAPGWDGLTVDLDGSGPAAVVTGGPVAEQIVLWQHATSVAAHLVGAVPPRRPSTAAQRTEPPPWRVLVDGDVTVYAGPWLPAGTDTIAGALRALIAAAGPDPYLAVHAYLDRIDDASAAVLRPELHRRTGVTTTFGWAPRCLPTAGVRAGGAICQITGAAPGTPQDDPLTEHQKVRAGTDAAVLARAGLPVLRLHLDDRLSGLVGLVRAVQEL